MPRFLKQMARATDALLSGEGVHFFAARTYYQAALYCAHYGSLRWFDAARTGFDAHARRIREIQVEALHEAPNRQGPNARSLRLKKIVRHCNRLKAGLRIAQTAGRNIRNLLIYRHEGNAEQADARILENQNKLSEMHRLMRNPFPKARTP